MKSKQRILIVNDEPLKVKLVASVSIPLKIAASLMNATLNQTPIKNK